MIVSKNSLTLPKQCQVHNLLAEFRHIIAQMRVQRVQCHHMAFLLYGHLPIHIAPKCVKAQGAPLSQSLKFYGVRIRRFEPVAFRSLFKWISVFVCCKQPGTVWLGKYKKG